MINVLYSFDDKYAPYAGISILSLLANHTSDEPITVFCGGMDISEDNIDKINKTVQQYGQRIIWLDAEEAIHIIETSKTASWNGSKAIWLKVLLPWVLPSDVDKILYIDSDTLVLGDVSEAYNYDMNGHLGMVLESVAPYLAEPLGLDRYFNSGVLLMDVNYWKDEAFKKTFLEHLDKNAEKYTAPEQCLLNDFFREEICELPMRFNMQAFHMLYSSRAYFSAFKGYHYYFEDEVNSAKENPLIIHFFRIFGDYPWAKGNIHPVNDEFHKWKNISLWKDYDDLNTKFNFVFFVEKILYRILPEKIFIKLFRLIAER